MIPQRKMLRSSPHVVFDEEAIVSDEPFFLPDEPSYAGRVPAESVSSNRATYNVISDTVVGLNVRKSDNKFQAISALVSAVFGSLVGAVLAAMNAQWNLPWFAGALIGAFLGLVVGVFASGIFLMIYRAIRHFKGEHG